MVLPFTLPAEDPDSATAGDLVIDAEATLAEAAPPEWPGTMREALGNHTVHLRVIIDAAGSVTGARVLDAADPRLVAPWTKAVQAWRFRPALHAGNPVVTCVDLHTPAVWPKPPKARRGTLPPPPPVSIDSIPPTKPQPKVTPPGHYPDILIKRLLRGEAVFKCLVGTDGRARSCRIVGANHPDFVQPALAALAEWVFEPARQGDLAIEAEAEGLMTFDQLPASRAEMLAANDLTAPDGQSPALQPEPVTLLDPVWPFDEAMMGEAGWALAEFTISNRGAVTEVEIKEASAAPYGHALAAALHHGQFVPAVKDGQHEPVRLRSRATFVAVAPGAEDVADPRQRVLQAMRQGTIGGAKGLDEKLTPLFRVQPVYPPALLARDRPSGTAEIECIIDRPGRVRLPRIVAASDEAFGRSAATALSAWVFKAPVRAGEPVDVRVRIPFKFVPPPL
jgi:TonB family protein